MAYLRIFRELDINMLSQGTREYLLAFEGQSDFVGNDVPRDDAYTVEVMRATTAYHLVDDENNSLATFKDLLTAEKALAGAKITFTVDVDLPEEEAGEVVPVDLPRRVKAKA